MSYPLIAFVGMGYNIITKAVWRLLFIPTSQYDNKFIFVVIEIKVGCD